MAKASSNRSTSLDPKDRVKGFGRGGGMRRACGAECAPERFARALQNTKGRLTFVNRPFLFCCAVRRSVTSRDPVPPAGALLVDPKTQKAD